MRYCIAIGTVLIAGASLAYELQPTPKAHLVGKEPVHESFTLASLACANAAAGKDVASLRCPPNELAAYWQWWTSKKLGFTVQQEREAREIINGVRWPDDPMRMSSKALNGPKLATLYADCKEQILERGACANRFCQSHYGNLQMLHAMVPSSPWCGTKAGASPKTCPATPPAPEEHIRGWVQWVAPIATGKVAGGARLFETSPVPATLFDQACSRIYPQQMTVTDLFFTSCTGAKNVASVTWCGVAVPSSETELRNLALGALLHLTQDSFSRAHVDRGGGDTCPAPAVVCGRVRRFREYGSQDPELHGISDRWPMWDPSCSATDRLLDDPVTAGAKLILWARGGDTEAMVSYLMSSVFAPESLGQAGAEDVVTSACYAPAPSR